MLSYKEYKQLNESLYGAFNLGIKQNNVLTPPIGATGESEILETEPEAENLEEAKKVCKKCGKGMDCECEKHDKDEEEKEEELTDGQKKLPKALQDAIMKKKGKKKDKNEDDHDHDDEDEDEDEDENEDKGLTSGQKKLPKALQDAILKKQGKKEWSEVMADVESLLEDIKNQKVIDIFNNDTDLECIFGSGFIIDENNSIIKRIIQNFFNII
jgi:hypothetical protein